MSIAPEMTCGVSEVGRNRRRNRVVHEATMSPSKAAVLAVVKRSGVTEPFSREKVVTGVRRACQGRPVDEDKLPAAQGEYMTFAGQDQSQIEQAGGAGKALLDSYKSKYGQAPPSSYVTYGVLALQVILAAIAKSDGTRKGVTNAVFSGDGISLSGTDSVLGKPIKIDSKSGDVNTVDISILQMKDQKETFLKPYPVA